MREVCEFGCCKLYPGYWDGPLRPTFEKIWKFATLRGWTGQELFDVFVAGLSASHAANPERFPRESHRSAQSRSAGKLGESTEPVPSLPPQCTSLTDRLSSIKATALERDWSAADVEAVLNAGIAAACSLRPELIARRAPANDRARGAEEACTAGQGDT